MQGAGDAARLILKHQLQVLQLAETDAKFAHYFRLLEQGTEAQYLEYVDKIQMDIARYWHERGVRLAFDTLPPQAGADIRALALEPPAEDYLWVSNSIRQLLWLEEHYAWAPIELSGWLRPGDSHRLLAPIAYRLWLLGDLDTEPHEQTYYDAALAFGVRHFQSRHGLTPDAVIGPQTLGWLNRTPMQRAELLARNFVEKTQYLARLGERYLLINIPAFELTLVDRRQVALRSKVIVGKPRLPTPQLQSEISNIILNPSWRVPHSILAKELLPQIRRDGDYLSQRRFDVFDYQGNKIIKSPEEWRQQAASKFPYYLVQRPGAKNALGRYKFHFSNRFGVYLHDTPDKRLFERADRALSHGCIRIEKVEELADWFAEHLIKDTRTWHRMRQGSRKTQWFSLNQPLPIYLVYWTAWVDEAHLSQYREDIYRLKEAGSSSRVAANTQAVN
ncbi:L,D-transpeptidase family protein [Shewanella sp. AS16]|uniref:L,D-transpeptidase family protein n=1 Tax=Shewanella sp. AS16 TaxID=2907625 RepID=UPI001EFF9E72|nr:L,D-transpeptidase family protein [Shewanella sp. AS16]MCE9684717.1 L,D-transpeptidase family protein [Shewanella sp. AS16]